MPDNTYMQPNDRTTHPTGWHEAFAALPQEAPDADAWLGVQRALPQRSRVRWPAWLAAAAALALAAVLPWQLLRTEDREAARPTPATADATARVESSTFERSTARGEPAASTPSISTVASAPVSEPVNAPRAPSGPAAEASRQLASRSAPARDTAAASARRQPKQPERQIDPEATRRIAGESDSAIDQATSDRPWPQASADLQLERLYAESAQLEALVALARDDRVATGAAATLTSAYDMQVAGIDAALREPDMDAAQRTALWQQRVDALRQLAGFESTQRMLAAQGEHYDAMLVSID